jgi:RNA polymerase sigma factor (sigma-70 family)
MSMEALQTPRQVVETLLLDPGERSRLLSFAQRRYGIRREAAEDVLQDAAVQLLAQRRRVRKPRAYLFSVFRIRCRRYLGSSLRYSDAVPLPDESFGFPDHDQETDAGRSIALHEGLVRISSACRKILAAHYIEGRSLRETAERMTLAYSGITKAISRCLKRLRACLT